MRAGNNILQSSAAKVAGPILLAVGIACVAVTVVESLLGLDFGVGDFFLGFGASVGVVLGIMMLVVTHNKRAMSFFAIRGSDERTNLIVIKSMSVAWAASIVLLLALMIILLAINNDAATIMVFIAYMLGFVVFLLASVYYSHKM
jgi:hypothetical protein